MQTVTEFLKRLAKQGVKLSVEAGQPNCYAPSGALTSEMRKEILRYKPEILALLEKRLAEAHDAAQHEILLKLQAEERAKEPPPVPIKGK